MTSPVRVTPVVAVAGVQARIGPVLIKLECLQRTGSFKIRGAWRTLSAMGPGERARGVVASSAGNHGAGVALAAMRLGVAATVVVPATAPAIKREHIAAAGARVIVHGAGYDDAQAHAREHAAATGAVFVSPFDDDSIIAGNGVDLADELLAQVPDLARLVCPVGGGGLIGGLGARLAPLGVSVIGVQPAANCAMYRSLEQGRALTRYDGEPTLADGLEGAVAERTYELVRAHVERMVLVTEPAIRRAVAFCYRVAGVVVECSAAVAMAAFLDAGVQAAGRGATVCLLTGSNIEPDLLDDILATEPA